MFDATRGLKDDSLIAVFDIASASVGGLLFRYKKEGLPEILVSLRQPANFSSAQNFPAVWRIFHRAFSTVAERLKKASPEKPNLALCVFSSPWYVSQTKILKVRKEQPFEINQSLLNDLIQDEAETFERQWHDSAWGEKGPAVFFEKEPIKAILNGYDVESPLGKTVQNLELYIYLSTGLGLMEEKIRQEILDYIKPQAVYFHTFPFVVFKTLRHVINTDEGLVLVDITGELSDVFLIRNNILEEANSFVRGENFLVRRLASVFNSELSEARALFSQYQRGELEPEYSQKVSGTLKPAGEEWGSLLGDLLKEMAQDKPLPQNFYFCGPAGYLKEVSTQVSNEDFSKLTLLGRPFSVNFLLPEALQHHFNFAKGFSNNKDIFLLISSLYASKFLNK